jgi:membrane protein
MEVKPGTAAPARFTAGLLGVVKELFRKYQRDNGRIIVASIAFNVLLTFIPFTLLSIFLLSFFVDMGSPGTYLNKLLRTIMPEPYGSIVVKRVMQELNFISISRKLSGPLGILALFFFSTRLFGTIRLGFKVIFGRGPEAFLKGAGKELLITLLFSVLQGFIFFSFLFTVAVQTKAFKFLPASVGKPPVAFFFSLLEMSFTFVMFYMVYYVLTPARRNRVILLTTTIGATIVWHAGKFLFKHYVLYLVRVTAFFGTYGVFIAFLFWIYFSAFVFVNCAELQSILLANVSRGRLPSSARGRAKP